MGDDCATERLWKFCRRSPPIHAACTVPTILIPHQSSSLQDDSGRPTLRAHALRLLGSPYIPPPTASADSRMARPLRVQQPSDGPTDRPIHLQTHLKTHHKHPVAIQTAQRYCPEQR
ncbi:MAG: hypothetical protein PUH21_03200 [Prevotellaceae bacterium]|nr:hypothetical protein [Prevotellaceae bacterium]